MGLIEKEKEKYESMWGVDRYRDSSPGEDSVRLFRDMAAIEHADGVTILDAGCGEGRGALALAAQGFDVTMTDLTSQAARDNGCTLPFVARSIWQDLRPVAAERGFDKFDHVYCCDVMEHVHPEFTMLAVQRMLDVARRSVFLSISLVPDNFGVWIGTPLHQTVRPFTWWRDRLASLGAVVECRDLIICGVYLVKP